MQFYVESFILSVHSDWVKSLPLGNKWYVLIERWNNCVRPLLQSKRPHFHHT